MSKHGKIVKVPVDQADPRPVEIPTELRRPETTDERIRRIIKEQISPHAVESGMESLEESEDFEIEDDFEGELPLSDSEFAEMKSEFPEILDQTGSPVESDMVDQPDAEKDQAEPTRKEKEDEITTDENIDKHT